MDNLVARRPDQRDRSPEGGRPHVLAVLYPAFGHVLPMLPILAELVRRGCRVTATTGPAFADRVRATGAEAVTYTTSLTDAAPPESITADELAWRTLRYLEEMLAAAPVIESCGRPDAVLYDTTLWAPPRVMAEAWGCPAVQVVPTFASSEEFSVAERLGRIAPPLDPAHPALTRFGELLYEYALAHDVPVEHIGGVLSGQRHLNLVTIPRAFQYFGETFGDDHVFVGPCLEQPVEDRHDVGWHPAPGGGPVALISLGTTVNEQPELFRRCAEAFAGTDWQVVMTVGGRLDPASLGPLPGNVDVRRWLPHAEVLRHAGVFVCQGGMGSVQESLAYAVPMVVVPRHHEQEANAERIAQLGLGHHLAARSLTAELVRDAVLQVAGDPEIARRTRAMHDEIRAAGGAARAAAEIIARATSPATT